MSKAAALAATGIGGGGAAFGGYLIFTNGGGEKAETTNEKDEKKQESAEPTLTFETLDSFISNPVSAKCVSDHFPGLEPKKDAPDLDASADTTFFKTSTAQGEFPKSCLFVEHKKTIYESDKWSGKFTWLWTVTMGDQGFINFNIAETPAKEPNKLNITGIFYLLQKSSSDNNKWVISHKNGIQSSESKSFTKDHLPKPTSILGTSSNNYFGFLNESDDLSKVCSSDECGTVKTPTAITKKEYSWTKKDGDPQHTLEGWSENLDWWTKLYTSTHWNMKTKIANFKGEWKEVVASVQPQQ